MTLSDAVRKRLAALMEEKGLHQYDFFSKGGMARSTVSQILSGARKKEIAVSTIYEMCCVMGITLGEFFSDPIFDEVTD